jgi:hypothetical protein
VRVCWRRVSFSRRARFDNSSLVLLVVPVFAPRYPTSRFVLVTGHLAAVLRFCRCRLVFCPRTVLSLLCWCPARNFLPVTFLGPAKSKGDPRHRGIPPPPPTSTFSILPHHTSKCGGEGGEEKSQAWYVSFTKRSMVFTQRKRTCNVFTEA